MPTITTTIATRSPLESPIDFKEASSPALPRNEGIDVIDYQSSINLERNCASRNAIIRQLAPEKLQDIN